MAANPPTAAGRSATASRGARLSTLTPGLLAAASTQGSPAYPSRSAHWPRISRSATNGFHAYSTPAAS